MTVIRRWARAQNPLAALEVGCERCRSSLVGLKRMIHMGAAILGEQQLALQRFRCH